MPHKPNQQVGVTHDGIFHADEVTAAAVLEMLGVYDKLIRTRDPVLIASAYVVFDVGADYDISKLRFDHHQANPATSNGNWTREDGFPMSSIGMIWQWYGEQFVEDVNKLYRGNHRISHILSREEVKTIAKTVDEKMIKGVDAIDVNGASSAGFLTYSSLISMKNAPSDSTHEAKDIYFRKAVRFASQVLMDLVTTEIEAMNDRKEVWKLMDALKPSQKVLDMPRYYNDWPTAVLLHEKRDFVLFGVHPQDEANGKQSWRIRALPPSLDNRHGQKVPFPKEWRNLSTDELRKVTGVATATFVHINGFIAGCENEHDAYLMASNTMKIQDRQVAWWEEQASRLAAS